MICARCHKPMVTRARFCMYCGALAADSGGERTGASFSPPSHPDFTWPDGGNKPLPQPPARPDDSFPDGENKLSASLPLHQDFILTGRDDGDVPSADSTDLQPVSAPPSEPGGIPEEQDQSSSDTPVRVSKSRRAEKPRRAEKLQEASKDGPYLSVARLTGLLLLLCLPIANLILACVWAFSGEEKHRQRRDLARAALMVILLGWVLLMAVTWWLITRQLPLLNMLFGLWQ